MTKICIFEGDRIVQVNDCARCGDTHYGVEFRQLTRPFAPDEAAPLVWTHWAMCPSTGEPVLLMVL